MGVASNRLPWPWLPSGFQSEAPQTTDGLEGKTNKVYCPFFLPMGHRLAVFQSWAEIDPSKFIY